VHSNNQQLSNNQSADRASVLCQHSVVIDVGKIDSGDSTTQVFNIAPRCGNFKVTVAVFLNLWNLAKIPAGNHVIFIIYLPNGTFLKQA
jgi:hypothetical protein